MEDSRTSPSKSSTKVEDGKSRASDSRQTAQAMSSMSCLELHGEIRLLEGKKVELEGEPKDVQMCSDSVDKEITTLAEENKQLKNCLSTIKENASNPWRSRKK